MRQFMRMRFIKRRSVFSFTTISFFLLLGTLFASTANAQLVSQITSNGAVCGGDFVGYGNCTAGEISVSQVTGTIYDNPWQGDQACVRGETITALETTVEYSIKTSARYDLLLWLGEQEGTDPRDPAAGDPAKSCLVASLPGPFPGGTGNNVFIDLEGDDQCADINGSAAATAETRVFTNLSVECQDNDNDGFADIQLLLTWSQNQNQLCGLGNAQSFPTAGAGSKCDYQILNTTLEIVEPASLTIVKNTIGGDGTFDFGLTGGLTGTAITTSGGTGSFTYTELRPIPDLDIFETLVPNSVWDATDITCTGATNNGTFTDSATFPSIQGIVIDEGQDVVCTVSNTKLASLTVVKNTTGGNGSFGFEGNNNIGLFTLDTGVTNTAQTTFSNLQPGTDYSLQEAIPNDWNLAAASCSTGGETADLDTGLVTGITLPAGGDVTCTFNNAKPGLSTITKTSVGGLGTFDFTITNAPPGTFSLTTTGSPSGGSSAPIGITLSAGKYVITENDPSAGGWTLTDIQCTEDGTQDSIIDIPNRQITLNVQDGETIACDVTNTKDGTVIVEKQTIPAGDPADFVFSGDLAGTLSDGETLTLSDNFTAAATSDEFVIDGWDLTDITCTGGTGASTIAIGGTASFNTGDTDIAVLPAPGETITCVYTNTKLAQLTIVKHITATGPLVQDFGFTSDILGSETFTLSPVDPATDDQRVISGMDPGIYAVGENPPGADGWALTGASCSDGSPVTAIVLSPGENLTCTFTNSPLGSTTIIKNTVGGDETFDFVGDDPIGVFDLDTTLTPGTASADFTNILPAGTYQVTESLPPASWVLTDVGCVDDQTNNSSGDLGTATATIDVDLGETVTCTFENTADAQLVIEKATIPTTDSTSFGFRSLITGQVWDSNGTTDTTLSNGTSDSLTSQPGPQFVSETPVSGYAITDIECIGDTNSFIAFAPSGADTFQTGDTSVEAILAAGEVVTCTYTNTKQGSLTIVKETVGDDGSFAFNHNVPNVASPLVINTAVDDTNLLSTTLLPGSYTVSEVVPTGWDLSLIACTGNTDSTITIGGAGGFDPGDNAVTVDMRSGEDIVCTFTNTQQGKILVDKVTDPFGSTESFDFTSSYGNPFSLTNAAPANDSGPLSQGQYSVTETAKAGWDLTTATCSDGSAPDAIALAAGEIVTCTFTNTIQRGKIVVDKVTDPVGSTQSFAFVTNYGALGFNLTDAAAPNDSGDLLPSSEFGGTYSVVESPTAGWTETSAVCTGDVGGAKTPGAIDLLPDETVICTFTNTIEPGRIIVDKQTAPAGAAQLFDFTLTGTGVNQPFQLADATPPHNSGDLLPTSENGTYNVSETVPTDWTQISATCSDGSPPAAVNLSPGEVVTCTFVNSEAGNSTLSKVTIGGDATFSFTSDTPAGNFSLTTVNGISPVLPIAGLDAGTYFITESALVGWDLTDLECIESGIQDSTTDIPTRTITLRVEEGETISCTVTNTKQGSITVSKVTVPSGDPAQFAFTGDVAGSIGDGGTITVPNLAPATYTSVEGALAGWDLTGIQCDDGASTIPSTGDVGTMTATFNLDAGEDVICTFTNTLKPVINLAKTVVGTAVMEANGTYTVVYSITATNTGGPGMYDLVDAFSPGSGITLNTATATYVAGSESSQNGTLGAYPNFVTDEGLAAGLNESWSVTANFTINPVLVDPVDSQCDPSAPAINTGFYNAVRGSDTDADLSDNETCTSLPAPVINLAKTAAPAVDVGGGIWQVVYTITASNSGQGPGVYDITDLMSPGAGITPVIDATYPALAYAGGETQTGTLTAPPLANGGTWVTDEALAAGASESWKVTARFRVDPATLDPATSSCDPGAPAINTGFYNAVSGSDTDPDSTDNETCTGLSDPVINLAKTAAPAVDVGGGIWQVVYTITATNSGQGPGVYDITDTMSPGTGITPVLDATYPGLVYAGGETQTGTLTAPPLANGGTWVTDEGLAAQASESWTVTANFTVDPATLDPATTSCDSAAPVINTGFYNAVSGSATDVDPSDDQTCTGLPFATLTVMKQVNGGSALPSDFVLTLTGADGVNDGGVDYMSGDQPPVKVGIEYLLTETPDQVPNYLDGGVSCTDNAGNTPVPYPVTLTAGQSITCTQVNNFRGEPVDVIAVPVNDKLALLLLTLMLLASGWYFRPATMRK
jgi:hypothetical protein